MKPHRNPNLIGNFITIYREAFLQIVRQMTFWSCSVCDDEHWNLPTPLCPTCGADEDTTITITYEDHGYGGDPLVCTHNTLTSPMAKSEGVRPHPAPKENMMAWHEDIVVAPGFTVSANLPERYYGHVDGCNTKCGMQFPRSEENGLPQCNYNYERPGEAFVGRFFISYLAHDNGRNYGADYGVYEAEDGTVRVDCWNN